MPQTVYTCIEQLDLASQQLSERNPSYGRLALILVDNVVELISHSICTYEIAKDEHWARWQKSKFTPDERADALGQKFDKKIKLCRTWGKLSQEQTTSILICHKYRNELYHAGLKHNDVVWDIAWYYHSVGVQLLEAFPYRGWSSSVIASAVVEKHAGEDGLKVSSAMDEVATSLASGRPARTKTLSKVLSESAIARIEEMEHLLRFLVSDDPNQRTEEEILEFIQFHDFSRSEDPVVKAIWPRLRSVKQQQAALVFLKEIWKPKHKKNPLPGFMKQAEKIGTESSEVKALERFEAFKRDITYFAEIIDKSASALDDYNEQQEDIARGK